MGGWTLQLALSCLALSFPVFHCLALSFPVLPCLALQKSSPRRPCLRALRRATQHRNDTPLRGGRPRAPAQLKRRSGGSEARPNIKSVASPEGLGEGNKSKIRRKKLNGYQEAPKDDVRLSATLKGMFVARCCRPGPVAAHWRAARCVLCDINLRLTMRYLDHQVVVARSASGPAD